MKIYLDFIAQWSPPKFTEWFKNNFDDGASYEEIYIKLLKSKQLDKIEALLNILYTRELDNAEFSDAEKKLLETKLSPIPFWEDKGGYIRIYDNGDYNKIGSLGFKAEISSTGFNCKIASFGEHSEITSSGSNVKIGSYGANTKIACAGDNAIIVAEGFNTIVSCTNTVRYFTLGFGSCISIPLQYFNGRKYFATARAGENGIKPYAPYTLNSSGYFVEFEEYTS
ncbi:hypothetical protein REJ26_004352 [Providencia stuartii]|uniref:hypothetical protein n=1 Tax=Providencia TaxID=586 RepID=UPI00294159D7|nr:hypothetical protein [Providencia sp. 2023EL-00965]ELR5302490.1 hypothetical protein [Providencia stuartii]MDW7590958.1 hypothetical protein [Providencia sp. 2023EL-00965]